MIEEILKYIAALGIHNGDVKLIKNAGRMILDPYDSTIRSLLIAILDFGVEESW